MTRALNTSIDQYNLYVGNQDITSIVLNATATNSSTITATATNSILNVSATATGSNTSQTISTTQQNGLNLFLTISSISVNVATLAVVLNAIDPLTGTAFPCVKVSVDGVTNQGQSPQLIQIFPGISATLAATNSVQVNNVVPSTFSITASLTMTTSASQTGVLSYKIGGSKLW